MFLYTSNLQTRHDPTRSQKLIKEVYEDQVGRWGGPELSDWNYLGTAIPNNFANLNFQRSSS